MENKSFSSGTIISEIKHVVFADCDHEEKTHDKCKRIFLFFEDFQDFEAENEINQLSIKKSSSSLTALKDTLVEKSCPQLRRNMSLLVEPNQ